MGRGGEEGGDGDNGGGRLRKFGGSDEEDELWEEGVGTG